MFEFKKTIATFVFLFFKCKQMTGESVISRENVAVDRIRTEEEQEIANNKRSIIWKSCGGWNAASILLGIDNLRKEKKM